MPAVQRKGDANSGSGVATGGIPTVLVNGQPIMVVGQPVSAHPPYARRGRNAHNDGSQKTAGGVPTVFAGGQSVVVTGNADTCGHPRQGGSPDVRAGG